MSRHLLADVFTEIDVSIFAIVYFINAISYRKFDNIRRRRFKITVILSFTMARIIHVSWFYRRSISQNRDSDMDFRYTLCFSLTNS